jgi:alkenylglycerophosphocholine/alkenylglycerophosphoethanolamine hydrolase
MNGRTIFFLLLFLFSAGYIVASPYAPFPGSIILKAIPVWMVAGHVFLTLKDRKGRLLFVGLLFGSGGDLALATDYSLSFMIGLGLFLIGHIFYISSFSMQMEFKKWRMVPSALVLILAVALSAMLTPYLADLLIPVYAYVFIITAMAIFAIFRKPANPAVWIGAVLFVISDAIIAINKFMFPVPHESYLIMGTYYLAQILIGEGSIKDEKSV